MFRLTVVACLWILMSATAFAATLDRAEFEAVLVPMMNSEVLIPGSHGSLWATELWVRNGSNTPVTFAHGEPWCPSPFCAPGGRLIQIAPLRTEPPYVRVGRLDFGMSALFFVERNRSDNLFFSLRIRDVSRNAESAGTMIPIVRERELFADAFELINVPLDSGRVNIRIYEAFGSRSEIRVDLFPMNGEEPLASRFITIEPEPTTGGLEFQVFPSEAVVFDIATWIGDIAGPDPIRIRIEPQNDGLFWGFASITNNLTQQVTIVAPD